MAGHDSNQNWLRKRHQKNRKLLVYKLAGTINILQDLTVAEIRLVWARITRKLRTAGVVAWWIREISRRTNRVHYHLVVASDHSEAAIKQLIRAACPTHRFRLSFPLIRDSREWSNYLCKSTEFAGMPSFYAGKVVLFEDWVKLDKHGEIGRFWLCKPKKRTPAENQARRELAHKFQQAANDFLVVDAAEYLSDATGLPEHEIVAHYARELIADPTTYQSLADAANKHRGEKPYAVAPFSFTPCPPARKPPVRTKHKPHRTPLPPFDPRKCYSFTIGTSYQEVPN